MDIAPITTKIYRLTQHILQHGDKMSTTTITGTDTKNVNAVVIWVSRHDILPAQYRVLREKLGNIAIYFIRGRVPSVEQLVKDIEDILAKNGLTGKPVYIVPVLPMTMIAKLLDLAKRRGWTVLMAEMENTKVMNEEPVKGRDYNPEYETVVPSREGIYRIMRFKRFSRIKAIKLETEPF